MRANLRLTSAALLALLAIPAWGAPPPPGSTTLITPTNGATARTLGNQGALLSPSPYATTDAGVKPYPDAQLTSTDLSGAPHYITLEMPSDFTAVKLRFANTSSSSYTITSLTVAASSQWAAPSGAGLNGGTGMYGVSAYDAAGNDVTATAGTWWTGSFGSNGADSVWVTNPSDFVAGGIAAITTASASGCSGSVLNVTSANFLAQGQTAVRFNPVTAANGALLYHLSGISSLAATLDGIPNCAVGDTWEFLNLGITVPAAVNVSIPSIVSTDVLPVVSMPRRDGPVIPGETPFLDGSATPLTNGMTANVVGPTSVSLTGGASPALLQNQLIRWCTQINTSGAITPTNTISLVSGTGVANGMIATLNTTAPGAVSQGYDTTWSATVTNVATNTITVADMIDPSPSGNWSGTMILASSTITGQTSSGSSATPIFTVSGSSYGAGTTSFVVNDTGANLAAWQSAIAAGVSVLAMSSNLQANSAQSDAVVSINAGTRTIVVTTGSAGALLDAQPVILYFQRSISGTLTPAKSITMATAAVNNLLAGSEVVGPGWKQHTRLSLPNSSASWLGINFDKSPTATIATATPTWFCHAPMKLASAVPAGATSLPFAQTNYPYRLLLVRVIFGAGSAQTTYQGPGADWGAAVAYGLPQFLAGSCNPGNNSVLTPALATNTGGGCNTSLTNPIYEVQLETPLPVVGVMPVGDSQIQGATTPYNALNYTALAAADLWSEALPFSIINAAWSGAPGSLFGPVAKQSLQLFKPGIVVIEGMPNNWPSTTQGYAQALNVTEGIAAMARSQGALPVLTDNYPTGAFGFTTLATINPFKVSARTLLSSFAKSGRPYLDTTSIVGATFGGNAYIAAPNTGDAVHLLYQGHLALEAPFEALIAPYVMKP